MKFSFRSFSVFTVVALGLAASALVPAFGQEGGKNEAGGFVGLLHGDGSNQTAFGGEYTATASKSIGINAKLGYSRDSEGGITTNSYFMSAGPQYFFPVASSSKVRPFAGVGVGMLHVGADTNGWGSASVNKFSVNFGGGVRLDVSKKWVVKPEFNVIKAVDIPVYESITCGIAYRF